MITSYVTPRKTILYLSLVGPLDRDAAADLVDEYRARVEPDLNQVLLDLTHAEQTHDSGLRVLPQLASRCRARGIALSVVAAESPAREPIAAAARGCGVEILDGCTTCGSVPLQEAG